METKLIELRDKSTFISAIAVALTIGPPAAEINSSEELAADDARKERERYLLRRAGYSQERLHQGYDEPYILLTDLTGGRPAQYDAFGWTNRTWSVAHQYLDANWSAIKSGDVIDVQFILGETDTAKRSEQETAGDYA